MSEKPANPEDPINAFTDEMRALKAETENPHWKLIDPETLGMEEMAIYNKLKAGTLEQEEFDRAREHYRESHPGATETDSGHNFYAYVANKLGVMLGLRRLEERKMKNKE